MAKEAYFFSHDSNARNDIKVVKLRREYGMEGYGIYFALIEVLREQSDYKMDMESISVLAYDFKVEEEKVRAVIEQFDLFEIVDNYFFSDRLLRSMEAYNELKNKRVQAGIKGAKAKLKQSLSKPQALKEKKGKEKKGNNTCSSAPTLEDFIAYVTAEGYSEQMAKNAFAYYSENNWRDKNGTEVKNWKLKLRNNWFKDEHKAKGRLVKMRNPQTGAEVTWDEEKYNRLKNTTAFTFLGYAS